MHAQDWVNAYKEHVLEHGNRPASVFLFAKHCGHSEKVFYEHFASFDALEESYWQIIVDKVRQHIEAQEVYEGYSARERLLFFYFTAFEHLLEERSFVAYLLPAKVHPDRVGEARNMAHAIRPFIDDLLLKARQDKEIVDRPLIGERYGQGLAYQWPWLVRYWLNDRSKGFEQTDAAVEKTVSLAFELMDRNPLDSIVDFGKFLYQSTHR